MREVVIDTNILVSALWSRDGNPFRIIEMIFANELLPHLNSDVIDEYFEVLSREKLGFTHGRVEKLLDEIIKKGIFSSSNTSEAIFVDESDRKFYELAKTNGASLITGNTKHYPNEAFIVTPKDFLTLYFSNDT